MIRINSKIELRDFLESYIDRRLKECSLDKARDEEKAEKEDNKIYYRFIKALKPKAFEFYAPFKIKAFDKIVLPDTTGDWTFQDTNWQLSNVHYVSSPSALMQKASGLIICTAAGIHPINEGMVASYFYKEGATYGRYIGFTFRHQGSGSWTLHYDLVLPVQTGATSTLSLKLDGSSVDSQTGMTTSVNSWFKRRGKFWESESHLIARWELADGTQEGRDLISNANKYSGDPDNYSGLECQGHASTDRMWVDDTEIWKAS